MVDKALFLGTHGAKMAMNQLEVITNNLANTGTIGFRADYEAMKQYQANNKGQQTRSYSVLDKTYSDFSSGPMIKTGRDLDVAISGQGFIAVQTKTGKEGYTRAGDLQIKNGLLVSQKGDLVLGTGGIIDVGQAEKVSISNDGSVSVRFIGQHDMVVINRIKLTNPPLNQIQKGTDGLFYMNGEGETAKQDDNVTLTMGTLEGSNVNPVQTLTSLIELSREFELETHLMKSVEDNSTKANQILLTPR